MANIIIIIITANFLDVLVQKNILYLLFLLFSGFFRNYLVHFFPFLLHIGRDSLSFYVSAADFEQNIWRDHYFCLSLQRIYKYPDIIRLWVSFELGPRKLLPLDDASMSTHKFKLMRGCIVVLSGSREVLVLKEENCKNPRALYYSPQE